MQREIRRLEALHDAVYREALVARGRGDHGLASALMDAALGLACRVDDLRLATGEVV